MTKKRIHRITNPLVDFVKYIIQFLTVKLTIGYYTLIIAGIVAFFEIRGEIRNAHTKTETTVVATSNTKTIKIDSVIMLELQILKMDSIILKKIQ